MPGVIELNKKFTKITLNSTGVIYPNTEISFSSMGVLLLRGIL